MRWFCDNSYEDRSESELGHNEGRESSGRVLVKFLELGA